MASTANFLITPGSGWVQVVTGPVLSYFTISQKPQNVPVHYTISTGAPALNAQGYAAGGPDNSEPFWANGAFSAGTNVYARTNTNAADAVRLYVFQN